MSQSPDTIANKNKNFLKEDLFEFPNAGAVVTTFVK